MTVGAEIVVQPLGAVPGRVLTAVARALRRTYGRRVAIAPTVWRPPMAAYRPRRDQYRGDLLLDWIIRRHEHRQGMLVTVADVDIYEPGYNFLFGLSYLDSCCALVALGRLGAADEAAGLSDRNRLPHRAAMIALHEFGHALGLDHCRSHGCVMRYEDRVEPVDRERGRLCRRCGRQISASDPE